MERTMQEKEELEMDHCEETEVHEELLRIVQEKLPKEEELYDLAELYKVFGDSTRIRILFVCLKRRSVSATLQQPWYYNDGLDMDQ